MEAFAASGREIAVIEAGIGGAMDVTNLVAPWATVIANVGLDHTAVLGDTLEKIAQQRRALRWERTNGVVFGFAKGCA